jgi:hypothetical protein
MRQCRTGEQLATWPGVGGERVLASISRGAAPFSFSISIKVGGRLLRKTATFSLEQHPLLGYFTLSSCRGKNRNIYLGPKKIYLPPPLSIILPVFTPRTFISYYFVFILSFYF